MTWCRVRQRRAATDPRLTGRDAAITAVKATTDTFGQVDVAENNAGYGLFGVEEIAEQLVNRPL